MSSIAIARTNYKRSCDTFATTNTNNLAFTNNELTIHGNSYANTPSPSSTTSSNITEHSTKRSKNNTNNYMFSKLRYRHEKLIQCTDSLTRHYILTSTNIIFQMQKQINKLKRRTLHLEQKLARQAQSTHPIIRIPRLTKDEISSICVNNHETSSDKQITNVKGTDEELNPNETPTNKSEPLLVITKGKFCPACRHEFSHRSGYLRHMRRMHKVDVTTSDATNHNEINETVVAADQPETDNEIEGDNAQILVNQWDIGEGRLRPRRVSKSYKEAFAKIKCNLCNKFFREDYIEKHVRRVHQTPRPTNPPDDLISPTTESVTDNQTHPADMSPLETVADMNINDTAVEFQDKSVKQIVLATTCLDTHQLEIVDEFVQAFGSHISQTTNVDSRTTHLIANDDKNLLRSPVSLKLIEGIAHHCFCVSYRWLIDCLKYDQLIDEYPYEIDSDDSGSHAHGGPRRSRLSDKNHGLFDGYCFMIKCTQKSDIYISNDRLQQLIQSCGGMIITCVTQAYLEQYKIVVLCDRLYVSERRHNYDQCRSLKINFLSSNWVLESILEYRLKPMESYLEKPL